MASAPPTKRTAAQTLERATTILDKYGLPNHAERARRTFRDTSTMRTVVILGEVKRGKSSLVNALVGTRSLLPVDVDICTSVPIHISAATQKNQLGTIDLNYSGLLRQVPHAELADWGTLSGRYVTDPRIDELPSTIQVYAPDNPLRRLVLVDTPGAGGLDADAVKTALTTAQGAGVLLMVCDATTPITAPEMDILKQALEVVGSVVVAVTKTDKNLRRWRRIVEDDRRLLKKHTGRDIPVIGVSSLRAVDAAEMIDEERRARVEQSSGIAELREHLIAQISRADLLAQSAGLALAKSGLSQVQDKIAMELATIEKPVEVLEELEAQRQELKDLREHGQEWEQYLQRNIAQARHSILAEMDDELERLREYWTNLFNHQGMKVLRSKPQVFTSQIEAALGDTMQRSVSHVVRSLQREVDRLFGDQMVWQDIAQFAFQTLAPPELTSKEVRSKKENLVDPSLVTMGLAGGGMLAGVMGVAAAAVMPVAIIGGAWMGINMAYRAMRNGKQYLVQWLRETISQARMNVNRTIDALINTIRPEIIVRYRAHIRSQSDLVKEQIDAATRSARQDEAQRQKTVERLSKNQAVINGTVNEILAHVNQIDAAARLPLPQTGQQPAVSAAGATSAAATAGVAASAGVGARKDS